MAKNNTGRGDRDISADDTVVRPRDEVFGSSNTTADSTIPAEEMRDLDLTDEDDADTLLSAPTTGATLVGADDDMVDSTASEPVLSETWGGGGPVPPSMVGETDTVSAPFATSSFGVTSASGAVDNTATADTDFKAQASGAVDSAKDAAAGALDQAKQKAGEVVGQAKEQVKSRLEDQKGRAVSGLDSLTQALRQTSETLQGAEVPIPLGDYAQSFAGQVDRFTSYLRDTDVDQIAHEVEDYARRNPVLFVGGAFLLGVAVARFLKSSESSATSYRTNGAANNFGTASRGGALVPVEGTARGELRSRTESGTSRFEEDALPDNRPMTAHNYVPGIGVTGTDRGEGSSL